MTTPVPPGHDLVTYDLRPRGVGPFGAAFADAGPDASGIDLSGLMAAWRTEIGSLNRVTQLWRTGTAVLPDAAANLVRRRTVLPLTDLGLTDPPAPGSLGPWFDLHTYTLGPGELDAVERAWRAAMPHRQTFSRALGVWHGRRDGQVVLVHVWPYPSLDDYVAVRQRVSDDGNWPPSAVDVRRGGSGYELVDQESAMLAPQKYSPIT